MRIAHLTDIHFQVPPAWSDLFGKRALGAANLYVRGRAREFSLDVQRAAIACAAAQEPDVVVVSGDLTAMALPTEFAAAREAFAPLLDRQPSLVIPGNHDAYTPDAVAARHTEQAFGRWMHLTPDGVGLLRVADAHGPVTLLGLDPNRPTGLHSSGLLPAHQLEATRRALADAGSERVVVAVHYPPVGPSGAPYDGMNHGLRNARSLLATLVAAPRRPVAVLCGHKHHGYRVDVHVDADGATHPAAGGLPIIDAGSAGLVYDAGHKRAGAVCVHDVDADGAVTTERFLWDGAAFTPEAGGAFASGW